MDIRPETAAESGAVRELITQAFGGSLEADIVENLRGTSAWLPEFSLVAEEATELVGYLLLSEVRLDTGVKLLSLGPMCVSPDRQHCGVGSALAQHALRLAADSRYQLVVVLGHPDYYPRFGFESARQLGVHTPLTAPDEAWMALRLPSYRTGLRGRVVYPKPWGVPG